MNYIDKVAWIYIKDRKVLGARSQGKDAFYIPGGKREGQETDEQCLVREVKEELTIDLKPETLVHVGTYEAQAHGKAEGVIVRMTCYTANFSGEIQPAAEVEEIGWLISVDIETNKTSPVDKIILKDLHDRGLVD